MTATKNEVLEVESNYYKKNKDKFAKSFPQRALLIYKEELIDDFATLDEAIAEGIRRNFPDPFLGTRIRDR